MPDEKLSREHVDELRAFIAVAEAGWKGSPCWHVLDWMSYRLRCKYPLIRKSDQIINWNATS